MIWGSAKIDIFQLAAASKDRRFETLIGPMRLGPTNIKGPHIGAKGGVGSRAKATPAAVAARGQAMVSISLMHIGEGRIYRAIADDAAICSVANRLGEMGGALLATVYGSYTAQPIEQRCLGVMHQPRTMGLIGCTRTPNRRRDRNAQLTFS